MRELLVTEAGGYKLVPLTFGASTLTPRDG